MISWKKVGEERIPEPVKGLDEAFDSANAKVNQIKQQLEEYLRSIRRKFGNEKGITYSHSKYRYEIEVPTELVSGNKKPPEFEFTSQRQGF